MAIKKAGDSLTWSSQSSGSWVQKTGTVLCVLEAGEDLHLRLAKIGHSVPPSRVKAHAVSKSDRYIVAVPREKRDKPGGPLLLDFYAPLVSTIELALARTERETALGGRKS